MRNERALDVDVNWVTPFARRDARKLFKASWRARTFFPAGCPFGNWLFTFR
jgi:hypothetical protein